MAAAQAKEIMHVDIRGVGLEVATCGRGRDILFLNSGSWLADETGFVEALASLGRVTAPTHPGFGLADAPAHLTTVDDLAYLYLDLVDTLGLENVVLVGASFGGWIAAEMAVKGDAKLAAIALIGAFGVKAGGREDRVITDLFATPDAEIEARGYVSPADFHRNVADLGDDDLTRRVRARDGLARFGWSPYMHDPKLPDRLHRVHRKALVLHGAEDRIVAPACSELYAARLPDARLTTVPGAAHFAHLEQPALVLEQISTLLGDNGATQPPRARETA